MAEKIKLIGLVPTGVLTVTDDVSALECVRLMRERNIGSLVVLDEPTGQSLVGIVTERDIVWNFEKLVNDRTMPVRRIMTSDVVTLPVGQLHRAAGLMLERGFRHIVFTYDGEDIKRKVAGIASARDLLREYVRGSGTRLNPFAKIARAVALLSDSDDSRRLFKSLFNQIKQSKFESHSVADFTNFKKLTGLDAVFIDLDRVPAGAWATLLREVLGLEKRPRAIAALFTPSAYDQKTLGVLAKLSKSGALSIVEKPLNLGAILDLLRD